MNKVVEILMKRDGTSETEATDQVRECRDMLFEGDPDPEEVIREELGLESDYIFDILDVV